MTLEHIWANLMKTSLTSSSRTKGRHVESRTKAALSWGISTGTSLSIIDMVGKGSTLDKSSPSARTTLLLWEKIFQIEGECSRLLEATLESPQLDVDSVVPCLGISSIMKSFNWRLVSSYEEGVRERITNRSNKSNFKWIKFVLPTAFDPERTKTRCSSVISFAA